MTAKRLKVKVKIKALQQMGPNLQRQLYVGARGHRPPDLAQAPIFKLVL